MLDNETLNMGIVIYVDVAPLASYADFILPSFCHMKCTCRDLFRGGGWIENLSPPPPPSPLDHETLNMIYMYGVCRYGSHPPLASNADIILPSFCHMKYDGKRFSVLQATKG